MGQNSIHADPEVEAIDDLRLPARHLLMTARAGVKRGKDDICLLWKRYP